MIITENGVRLSVPVRSLVYSGRDTEADVLLQVIKEEGRYAYVLLNVARHPNATAEVLRAVWTSAQSSRVDWVNSCKKFDVAHAIAPHRNTPADVLCDIAIQFRAFPIIWFSIARNPNTDSDTLATLAAAENYGVQEAVARHPNTSVNDLEMLAASPDAKVRGAAQANLLRTALS